jgi:hypothetical protein
MTTTKMDAWTLLRQRKPIIYCRIRLQMEAWTLLYIVEDNKDGDRSQTKGADYIHSYMKQGLGGI